MEIQYIYIRNKGVLYSVIKVRETLGTNEFLY